MAGDILWPWIIHGIDTFCSGKKIGELQIPARSLSQQKEDRVGNSDISRLYNIRKLQAFFLQP